MSYATTQGNITATMIGVGLNFGARNRGANTGGRSDLYADFAFAQRDGANGFGRNFVKLTLSGLTPNANSMSLPDFAREAAFKAPNLADPNDPGQSFQAWSRQGKTGWARMDLLLGSMPTRAEHCVNRLFESYSAG